MNLKIKVLRDTHSRVNLLCLTPRKLYKLVLRLAENLYGMIVFSNV